MKKITLQDIFNAAWQAFIVEGKPPATENGKCRYLTKDGRKCAVGLCLPDGHNSQKETKNLGSMIFQYPELFDINEDRYLLRQFQYGLHDGLLVEETNEDGSTIFRKEWSYSLSERERRYREIAVDYNLTVPTKD